LSIPEAHDESLQQLATQIERSSMREAIVFALDVLRPVDLLSSQFAQFSRPFLAHSRWAVYAAALAQEESWTTLRRLLNGTNRQ
jgi:predicted oxidoreductase (fatty acid repression mutant protein)